MQNRSDAHIQPYSETF